MIMQIIDSITYNYLNNIYWQNTKTLYNQKCILLDKIFSLQKNQYIENMSQIIYEEVCQLVPTKYKSLIYEQNFINTPIFKCYAEHLLGNIILQGVWGTIKDKFKKGYDIVKKHTKNTIQKGKKIVSAVGKGISSFANSTLQFVKKTAISGWNTLVKIGSAIWDGLKKLGQVVFGWIKAVWNFIKQGFKLFADLVTGGHCGLSSPQDAIKKTDTLTSNCVKSFKFMQGSVKSGKQIGQTKIQQSKNLDKAMAKGGNLDQELKKYTKSLGNEVKSASQSDLSSNGKEIAKNQGKQLQKSIPKENKKYLKEIEKNTPESQILKNKDNKENKEDTLLYESNYQTRMKYFSKLLKRDLINLTYKGITPKVLFQ